MRTQLNKALMSTILRSIMILILMIGMFGFAARPAYAVATVIYVDSSASGAEDGTSWANAYTDLQSAISPAPSAGTQVWVAAGTYYPISETSTPPSEIERSKTFKLVSGVGIYGGFDGTETMLDERDPEQNVTILSGDIGVPSDNSDNTFHVVTGSGTDSTAILDGFTITGGNADDAPTEDNGGGILNIAGSPTISNMIISGNTGEYGGGMYNYFGSNPAVTNVVFSSNTAVRAGGMYNNNNSNAVVTNVSFINNSVSSRGGAMTTSGSAPILTNVTFKGNFSSDRGGALHNVFGGNPTLTNVTFSGNIANTGGGAIYNEGSTPELINVTISNNEAGNGLGGAVYNENSNMVIANSILYNNIGNEIYNHNSTPDITYSIVEGGYTGDGNQDANPFLGPLQDNGGYTQTMALGSGSPAIDAGNDASCPADDQRGFTRPQGAHCDMGAYEADNQPPETTLVSFPPNSDSDNTPTFTFSGDDDGGSGVASFLCRMDGASYVACTSPFTSAPLSSGSHTFDVYAVDHALNADPTPASYTWQLEFTPTVVTSIARVDASPTSQGSVDFTVTFSANVSGVDSTDFELTTSGISGAAITGVTGSGTSYTVSVNTGTGDGTIRLDIPASADIQDPNGNQPVNLPYTSGESYKIIKDGTFDDVPNSYWAWRWIESFYDQGITTGCSQSPLNYCPDRQVTRAEMAVFILRAKYGSTYQPSPTQTDIFADVPVTNKVWMQPWIEQFYEEGITTGCTQSPLKYCPERQVTRAEMAVFILRALYGSSYQPNPTQTDIFADVPVAGKEWMQPWIEQFYEEGITVGCTQPPNQKYCPERPVTRAEMAVFIDRAFGIPPLP